MYLYFSLGGKKNYVPQPKYPHGFFWGGGRDWKIFHVLVVHFDVHENKKSVKRHMDWM